MGPVVVVHGGAGLKDESRLSGSIEGCRRAAVAGASHLGLGAVEAVVAAVRALEQDPLFNAGLGSTVTSEGTVELDAAVMTGDLAFGAVGACRPVASAVELALKVLERGEHAFLVGEGALSFAKESGIAVLVEDDLIVESVRKTYMARSGGPRTGTVGAVAVDDEGGLAAATSTGGVFLKQPGRIGDTPIPGGGTYADSESGAAGSATGLGESILRVLLTKEAVMRVGSGQDPATAGRAALDLLDRRAPGEAGLILLDARGRFFAGKNTRYMPWAACRPGESPSSGA